jgi:hypothetical protein
MVLETIYVTRHGVSTLSDVFLSSVLCRLDVSWIPRPQFPFSLQHKERVERLRVCIMSTSLARLLSRLYSAVMTASNLSQHLSLLFVSEKHTHHRDSSALTGLSIP